MGLFGGCGGSAEVETDGVAGLVAGDDLSARVDWRATKEEEEEEDLGRGAAGNMEAVGSLAIGEGLVRRWGMEEVEDAGGAARGGAAGVEGTTGTAGAGIGGEGLDAMVVVEGVGGDG